MLQENILRVPMPRESKSLRLGGLRRVREMTTEKTPTHPTCKGAYMGLSRGWGTISQEHMCHCLYALLSRRRQPPGEEPRHPLREMATPHTSRSRGKHRNRGPWNPLGDPPTQHTHTADLAKPTFCEPGEGGGLSQWTVGLYACAPLCCYLVILRTSLREEVADGRHSMQALQHR